MFRMWAKVIKDNKIVREAVLEKEGKFVYGEFFGYLSEICDRLDISTPVLLRTHILNFAKFRTVRFLPRDFTEPVDFDRLDIDNIQS